MPVYPRPSKKDLLREINDRETNRLVGKAFGVPAEVVARWREHYSLPASTAKSVGKVRISRERVKELTEQHVSLSRQARILGCTPKQISRIKHELKLTKPAAKAYPPEMYTKVEKMLDDGASYLEVQKTLGPSLRWLAKRFPGRGWTKKQMADHRHAIEAARKAGIEL